jgi:hypothetical protein
LDPRYSLQNLSHNTYVKYHDTQVVFSEIPL